MNKEEFIEKSKKIHGDKYDYTKVEYCGNKTKVCIICPTHGEFWQRPNNHLSGQECPKCGRLKANKTSSMTFEEFVKKANNVHNNSFEYFEDTYNCNKSKVKMKCLKCGSIMEKYPAQHLQGCGCSKCNGGQNPYTEEEILDKIHKTCTERNVTFLGFVEDKWESTKKTHLKLHCNICGNEWASLFRNFITYKHCCQKCYDNRRGVATRKTKKHFIEEAVKIHGNKYDYSKVEYINSHTKICIICQTHGEFWIAPNKHINGGQGCSKCADIKNGIAKRKPIEQVQKQFGEVHHGKYTYDWSTYVSMEREMKMFCPTHGEFLQTPFIHASGCGCKICNESHLEREIRNLLIENGIEFVSQLNNKTFEWLERQSIDFYLPKHNLFIECQGGQHLVMLEHFGGSKGFNTLLSRDIKKYNLCKENDIKMLYLIENKYKSINLSDEKFGGIYNDSNVFYDIEDLKNYILK